MSADGSYKKKVAQQVFLFLFSGKSNVPGHLIGIRVESDTHFCVYKLERLHLHW